MAGRIRASDIDEVKSRINIADVIGDHVSLKSAGVGSLKGLCPFHDEKSPSFHVRPQVGYYHCFGCGESGDVYSFLQKMDHVTFSEAVERLAGRIGMELHYEEGGSAANDGPNRARLYAANAAAAEYFQKQLNSPEAAIGRKFLGERGFDAAAAARFGVGFAPSGWDNLSKHLVSLGFTQAEMLAAGLLSQGDRGAYDRFRGRLVWPIRDITGQTIGFGARKLLEDDQGPKYLNTPETPIYHKAQVLYGLDLAKRQISKTNQVVVVEGYTDVMACHLAGVETAVATCGTAFGSDHLKLLKRVLSDDAGLGAVVFTFDPDAAGQKAALRAFTEARSVAAQTFIAIGRDGLDPCDLRIKGGDAAVRAMIEQKSPMFEFVMRHQLNQYDLNTVEGRVAGLRSAAAVIAEIRDPVMRSEYAHELARMSGMDRGDVDRAVAAAAKAAASSARGAQLGSTAPPQRGGAVGHAAPSVAGSTRGTTEPAEAEQESRGAFQLAQLPRDPATRLERDSIQVMLQHPEKVSAELFALALDCQFAHPALAVLRNALVAGREHLGTPSAFDALRRELPAEFVPLLEQLAVAPLPERESADVALYASGVLSSLVERDLLRQKAELLSQLKRASPDDAENYRAIQTALIAVEADRRKLREES